VATGQLLGFIGGLANITYNGCKLEAAAFYKRLVRGG